MKLLLAFALLATPVLALEGTDALKRDLPNFDRVSAAYYRGGQPTREGFKMLARLGVKTVIDFRDDPKEFEPGAVRAAGMVYVPLPMSTWVRPTDETIAAFLTLLEDPAASPLFVHCWRGSDRTGLMSAIRRMEKDSWKPRRAAKEMIAFRGASPPLIRFVFKYYKLRNPKYEMPDLEREFPDIYR
ncbi:MAG: hypothetical protein COB53_10940 [Elusimicrobia bacterium]|nr:MAG: hypothetical protein COB53_10940 [Elusimicrobiota bacterium]